MTTAFLMDIVGWAGALLVLSAYYLVSTRRFRGDTPAFQWLNLAGGMGLLANTIFYRAYPSSLVNVVWIVIAGVTLVRSRRLRG